MRILAIETSCDETAICLLEATQTPTGVDFCVIKNITHTQLEHVAYGGVFPALAKREHQKNLPLILETIMQDQQPPDYICVTNGPGLEPALWCGIVFAKELGVRWNIPVVPVNHMEGHILSVLVPFPTPNQSLPPHLHQPAQTFSYERHMVSFPAIALLISGGHTELVLVNEIGNYEIIGKTKDDAVGEAFDKVARMMQLPYPGGPEIARLATAYGKIPDTDRIVQPLFPRPMMHSKDFDFSFSGLKTAVLYYIQSLGDTMTDDHKQAIAAAFQEAATEVLVYKTKKAIDYFGAQTLIVGGGVAANTAIISGLTEMLTKDFPDASFYAPARELTGDNALMIALAGYFKIQKNPDTEYPDIVAVGNLEL